jgi:hypothetical protein
MNSNDGIPLPVVHGVKHAVPGKAGIVDQNVQPTEGFDRFLDNGFWKIRLSHIAAKDNSFASGRSNSFRSFGGRLLVQITHNQAAAMLGQQFSRSRPNAPSAARNDGYLVINQTHVPNSSSQIGSIEDWKIVLSILHSSKLPVFHLPFILSAPATSL